MKFKNISLYLFLFLNWLNPIFANTEQLLITSFGHSSFLLKGNNQSILLNPFKAKGCTNDLLEVNDEEADFILASSRLYDEGYNPNNKLMFVEPGIYKIKDIVISGISVPHDRLNGRRFGLATVWTWRQNNYKIVHMSGAAGPLKVEDQILLARPDILFISIGGGAKSYTGYEAANIVSKLKPKIIVPVHYLKNDEKKDNCDFSNSDEFLKNVSDYNLKFVGNSFEIDKKDITTNSIYIIE